MAKQPKTWRRRIMTWTITLFSLYVIYCGLLYFLQSKLMFPVSFAGQPNGATPNERLEIDTDEGRTVAWYDPASDAGVDAPTPLVVFFHGNAELVDQQQSIINLYRSMGISVFMVEYRGYGDSEGTPSQQSIVSDTVAMLKMMLVRPEIDPERLIFHGRSIGGGLATQVALQIQPHALIVESTFRSVSGMAWRYGVPPFLVTSPLKSEEAFKQLDVPILIMHGKADEIVPVSHSDALHRAAKNSTRVLFNASHNTLPMPAEVVLYEQSVRDHLRDAGVLP